MQTLHDILSTKSQQQIHTVPQEATVLEATRLMNEHLIGAVLVLEGGRMSGIFTERDVLRRVVAACRDPQKTSVGEVMTRQVICCRPDTSIDEARTLMKEQRIRRLPVVSPAGELAGLISIGDLNAFISETQEVTIHYMHEYLHGRA